MEDSLIIGYDESQETDHICLTVVRRVNGITYVLNQLYDEEESNFIDCINNEKYITRLLTFASTVLNPNVSCIVLSQKNVQELIEEIREDYIPKKVLNLELEERKKQLVNKKKSYTNRIRLNEIKHIKRIIL